jgi:hypothetical protein
MHTYLLRRLDPTRLLCWQQVESSPAPSEGNYQDTHSSQSGHRLAALPYQRLAPSFRSQTCVISVSSALSLYSCIPSTVLAIINHHDQPSVVDIARNSCFIAIVVRPQKLAILNERHLVIIKFTLGMRSPCRANIRNRNFLTPFCLPWPTLRSKNIS